MRKCRLPSYWARCLIVATTAAVLILLCLGNVQAADVQGKLKRDVAVGAKRDVQLKAGQVVQVVTNSGGTALIIVKMPDGSKGAYQIDSSALDISTPASTQPAAAPSAAQPAAGTTPPAPAATTPPPVSAAPTAPKPSAPPVVADPNLPEDKPTLIQVSLPQDTKLPAPYSSLDEAKAGSYSYKLYLPPGYYDHPDYHYPALFVMSPGGSAGMGDIKDRAKVEGWIVVMLMEAKNGPWGPIYGNQLATCADIEAKGIRIQKGLKFATGFSGGGRGTSMLTQICPGFNGELLQGAGFAFGENGAYNLKGIPKDHPYAVFMIVGTKDGNKNEIDKMKSALKGVPFKAVTFEGGHQPSPLPQKNQGLDWLMMQAFTGSTISDDLRACGTRHFGFLAKRWTNETDNAVKAEVAPALIAFGEKLNLPAGSAEAVQLKKIKEGGTTTP